MAGLSWCRLALALLDIRKVAASRRNQRCSPPTTKNLPRKPNTMRNHYLFGIESGCIQSLPLLQLSYISFRFCNNPDPISDGWVCTLDNCLVSGRMGPLSASPCIYHSLYHRAFFKRKELWERENVAFFTVPYILWLKDSFRSHFGFIQSIINFLSLSLNVMFGQHYFAQQMALQYGSYSGYGWKVSSQKWTK